MANANLTAAKIAKNDEFYTQYPDIEKEVNAYLEYNPDTFRGKVVYSNCDDPYESNFFRYFVLNFKRLGLKQYIATSYKPSPIANSQLELFGGASEMPVKGRAKQTANKYVINDVGDMDNDGTFTLQDIAEQLKANKNNEWEPLKGDGDFRSEECIALLEQADIVVTNPPFSLFREYVRQLIDHQKQLLIIGSMNAVAYKEIFPLIRDNRLWLGATAAGKDLVFAVPPGYVVKESDRLKAERLGYVGNFTRLGNANWFTNLDHGRRHQAMSLMSMNENTKFNKKLSNRFHYQKFDNYDAIEVPFTDAIPSDYDGLMGVPLSFLDKYNPDQFEIVGTSANGIISDEFKSTPGLSAQFVSDYYRDGGKGAYKPGNPTAGYYDGGKAKMAYQRIFIRHRKEIDDEN